MSKIYLGALSLAALVALSSCNGGDGSAATASPSTASSPVISTVQPPASPSYVTSIWRTTFVKGRALSSLDQITYSGGQATSCTVSPALPAGISLDNNCLLSGTPTETSPAQNYTFTVSNSGGSSQVVVQLGVAQNFAKFMTGPESDHNCGINTDGELYCWGNNSDGQIGDGSIGGQQAHPIRIDAPNLFTEVAGGPKQTCAITTTGVLKCWGDNYYSPLGTGAAYPNEYPSPTVIDAGLSYSHVSVGHAHICGTIVTSAGSANLRCWGYNQHGELGTGNKTTAYSPQFIGTGNYLSVAAGNSHSCAVDSNNDLYCWGQATLSQLGFNTSSDQVTPHKIDSGYVDVKAGVGFSCAVATDGTVNCWGDNSQNQYNSNTTAPNATPAKVGAIRTDGTAVLAVGANKACVFGAASSSGISNCGTNTRAYETTILNLTNSGGCAVMANFEHVPACWGDNSLDQWGNENAPALNNYSPL